MPQKILITGGTGLVGTRLIDMLLKNGFSVNILSRGATTVAGCECFLWDVNKQYIDERAFENVSIIIHLAGAGIADKPWTEKRKSEIISSRVKSANLLYEYVQKLHLKIDVFISSSAIGYYGSNTGNIQHDENSPNGTDFLAQVCQLWENAAYDFKNIDSRVVCVRTGIVLDKDSGALPKMAFPVKYGFGAYLGYGSQWMSWIHVDDLCEIFLASIKDSTIAGPINAVAPNPVTNKEFTRLLGQALHRWVLPLYIPNLFFKIIFGEMAIVVTGSCYVKCKYLSDIGFVYKYRTLDTALQEIYKQN